MVNPNQLTNLNNLNDADKQHITEQIQSGNYEGELNGGDWRGWWRLKFEKWED